MTRKLALQISPEAKGAYFADYLDVSRREFETVFPDVAITLRQFGPLSFFELSDTTLDHKQLTRLSFVQGLYEIENGLLRPLEVTPEFPLHDDFVFGSKFRGKTNERLSQLLINVGLSTIGAQDGTGRKLLDPMCGRATSLIWAMQYGFTARGIEQDAKAPADIERHLKKWTKLHRVKHKFSDGFIGPSKKNNLGKFIEFSAANTNMRIVTGDARKADQIYSKDKFDLIVSDLPYGVQHFTTERTRNPLTVIEQCVEEWAACLKKGGAMVLAFNRNNPKRDELISLFEVAGLVDQGFSAEHRMSESIVRDVVVFKHG